MRPLLGSIMIELLGIISGVLGVVGVLLNNRKLRVCFLVWLVSNGISCGLHMHAGLWSLAARDALFFLLSLDGWRRWRGHQHTRRLPGQWPQKEPQVPLQRQMTPEEHAAARKAARFVCDEPRDTSHEARVTDA